MFSRFFNAVIISRSSSGFTSPSWICPLLGTRLRTVPKKVGPNWSKKFQAWYDVTGCTLSQSLEENNFTPSVSYPSRNSLRRHSLTCSENRPVFLFFFKAQPGSAVGYSLHSSWLNPSRFLLDGIYEARMLVHGLAHLHLILSCVESFWVWKMCLPKSWSFYKAVVVLNNLMQPGWGQLNSQGSLLFSFNLLILYKNPVDTRGEVNGSMTSNRVLPWLVPLFISLS